MYPDSITPNATWGQDYPAGIKLERETPGHLNSRENSYIRATSQVAIGHVTVLLGRVLNLIFEI